MFWDYEINKEALKQILKEHMSIEIKEENSYGTKSIDINIKFDGEVICSDSYNVTQCLD